MTVITLPDLTGINQRSFLYLVSVYCNPADMSFVDTLRQWDEAVTCADRQDFPEALRIFLSIQEPNSKICFNIGCLHLLNQELDAAEKVSQSCEVKNVGENIMLRYQMHYLWTPDGKIIWMQLVLSYLKEQVTVKEEVEFTISLFI